MASKLASESDKVGELIKSYRNRSEMTQLELASALGYENPQFVYLLENGRSKVPDYLLKRLIKVLGIPEKKIIDALVFSYRKKLVSQIRRTR